MILPSYSFIFIFLPLVVILYHLANSRQLYLAGKVILLVSSAVFYALLTPGIKGLIALFVSVLVCYLLASFGLGSGVPKAVRKISLAFGVTASISFLIYCRYLGYINELLVNSGGTGLTFEAVIVPVGISYFTFSQIAYLVDTYRNPDTRYSFADYLLFVSFFPKISVGPIALAGEMIPQFNDPSRKKVDYNNLSIGFYRFTLGLSKKLLLADSLGKYADSAYANIPSLGSADAALAILSYTLQIYFDFSGYCDIASGICKMLNIDLCENFDGPYKSLSIREFWKRWHMTLTAFLTKYLYIPIGGSRKGKVRTYLNVMIVFLVSGIWHGAGTGYIVWGLFHGAGMVFCRIFEKPLKWMESHKITKALLWIFNTAYVAVLFSIFRGESIGKGIEFLKHLIPAAGHSSFALSQSFLLPMFQTYELNYALKLLHVPVNEYGGLILCIGYIVVAMAIILFAPNVRQITAKVKEKPRAVFAIPVALALVWSFVSLSGISTYIYYNF